MPRLPTDSWAIVVLRIYDDAIPDAVCSRAVAAIEADDEHLLASYGRWYIPRRDPRYLRRNALVVLGNTGQAGDRDVDRVLDAYATGSDDLLAEHARWAQQRIEARAAV